MNSKEYAEQVMREILLNNEIGKLDRSIKYLKYKTIFLIIIFILFNIFINI
jgi:hypothetical protein